ncbi:AGC family protein kinase [Histomonas meleagridis]|uniref:AGC family protein kinase n=1 Tax=Histomonas meleagridis TaxID=135588 RepID=UPI0035598DB6|nr:AGC family protein kinase [Histomonas meleagridis]KAH0805745.1 AGC family protein kinase [Histomonas meleagridis]
MALQFLRENKIIHRDLKPNNILIDSTGHLKLIDFGLSYYGMVDRSITTNNTFVGTPGYAAPEMILGQSHTFTADYWSLGSILYEFLVGEPPFPGDSSTEIFQKTLKGHYNEENLSEFSDEVQDLIHKLLCLDPNKRIGSKSIDEIKSHKWFESIRWDKMEELELPFIPELKDRFDTSYFIPPNQNIVDEIDEDILEDIQLDYDDNYNDVDDLKLFESVGIKQLEDKTNKDALDIRKRKHLSIDVPENLLKDLEENQFQRRKHRMVPRSSLSPKKFAEINCFNNNSESKTDFDFE